MSGFRKRASERFGRVPYLATARRLVHALNLAVVAEGVETEAQVKFLHDHGCDEIQGYWLARPLRADECATFLHSWASATAETGRQAVSG